MAKRYQNKHQKRIAMFQEEARIRRHALRFASPLLRHQRKVVHSIIRGAIIRASYLHMKLTEKGMEQLVEFAHLNEKHFFGRRSVKRAFTACPVKAGGIKVEEIK